MRSPVLLAAVVCVVGPLSAQNELRLQSIREIVIPSGRRTVTYSPDGRWLACGGLRGDLALIDTATGRVARTIDVPGRADGELRFSADSERLAVVSGFCIANQDAADLRLYDVGTGRLIADRPAQGGALDWSRDGRWIAVADNDTDVSILRASDLHLVRRIQVRSVPTLADRLRNASLRMRDYPHAVALTRDGRRLAVALAEELKTFDSTTGRLLGSEKVAAPLASGLRYSDDGALHWFSWRSGDYMILGGRRGKAGRSSNSMLRVQPDGSRCALVHARGTTFFHRDGTSWVVPGEGSIALHPDGRTWARAGDGFVDEFVGRVRRRRIRVPSQSRPLYAVITTDGAFVAVRAASEEVLVFDVSNGAAIDLSSLHGTRIFQNHTSDLIGTLGRGRAIEFWDPRRPEANQAAKRIPFARGTPVGERPRFARDGIGFAVGHRWWRVQRGALRYVGFRLRGLRVQHLSPSDRGESVAVVGVHGRDVRRHVLQVFRGRGDLGIATDLGGKASDLDYSPNGRSIVVATSSGSRFYSSDRLTQIMSLDRGWVYVRFVDDRHVLGVTGAGRLELFALHREVPSAVLELESAVSSLEVTRNGTLAVLGLANRVVVVALAR